MHDSPTTPATGRSIRFFAVAACLALAGIAAVISYQHALEVVQAVGQSGPVAYLVPLVADLTIFSSSLALLDAARRSLPKPPLAVVGLGFGIGATLAMNVAAGSRHGAPGALVSALAPVALVLSFETLMTLVRRAREDAPIVAPGHPKPCGHGVARTGEEAVTLAYLHGRDCVGETPSQRQLAAITGVGRAKVAELVRGVAEPMAAEPVQVPDEVPA